MRRVTMAAAILAFLSITATAAEGPRGYVRYPAIHGDTVVFTAEGDLWKVGTGGGVAQRLTSHPGMESRAAISPDGASVAFTASYEGPAEAYVMPLAGGLPRRLTWDGDQALVVGWTPDGRVLVATDALATLPDDQLFTIDPADGSRTRIPLAQAADGAYDDAGTLYFTRLRSQGSHTKYYKGGTAQNLWKLPKGAAEATPLTADFAGTSRSPMPWRGRVYFLSDRDGTMNLWSMDPAGRDLRQHTRHAGWDAATPSLSAGRIAYKLGADLHVYDIAADRDAALDVRLATDLDQLREKWVDAPVDYLTAAHLAPDGSRVVLTARGQVFVAPVTQGRLVEASRWHGVRHRQARFLPDGASIVALSDESGEVEWWRLPANGVGKPEQVSRDGKVLRFDGIPSPDGTWIASHDKDHTLWLHSLRDARVVKVATSPVDEFGDLAWSPDSAWLAYVTPAANLFAQIKLYEVATGRTVEATTDRADSYAPAWSPDGKWLYFISDRRLESLVRSPWGSRQPEPFLDKPARVYALALAAGQRFPFQPDDELKPKDTEKKADDKGKDDKAGSDKKPAVKVAIDTTGLQARLFEVPVPAGNLESLAVNGDRQFWLSRETSAERKASLVALDVSNKEPKPKTLVADVKSFELSGDGKKVLVRKGDTLAVIEASAGEKVDLDGKNVDLSGWKLVVDPREEFRQMFVEAWRLERDYFYDRGMHGLEWPAVLAKYRPLVDRVTDRAELSDLLGQMIGELSALHMFVYGGDTRKGKDDVEPASLGAALVRDEAAGGWRVEHVYRADPDLPDQLSPLARPGVDVRDGDVIVAINGTDTLKAADPSVLLRNQAGRQVLLRVQPAGGGEAREVIVTPIPRERDADLRYDEWEYTRRLEVDRLGAGRIGYVHLRAMGGGNWSEFSRDFYPVFDRAGLILDVRHNRGGNIDSWVLEKLLRRAWFYWQPRVGQPYWNMQYAFRGHMVVLVDQWTASDGEAFAEGFRRLGLGKVLGVRTWGGEIWLSSSNFLVDKGIATAAETGVYGPEGTWLIEGHGVEPDIVVDNLPAATFRGGDAQLEAAVKHLQELIAAKPVAVPTPPPYRKMQSVKK